MNALREAEPFSAIAKANARCILEAMVLHTDGAGGYMESWEPYALVWGDLTAVLAGAEGEQVTHTLMIKRRVDVSADHRVRIVERTFGIFAIIDADPQAFWMALLLVERVAVKTEGEAA